MALLALVLVYRALMAILREAFHALPSIQRRRLLEEEAVLNPLLAQLLERSHALGLGITLVNQGLLVLLLVLVWPLAQWIPGGIWSLGLLVFVYLWSMDLALPALLVAREPAPWLMRIFPFYAPVHRLLGPLVVPLAGHVERRREAQERVRDEEDEGVTDDAVTALLEEGEAEGILEEDDRELIRNVVGFGDTVVREVMTPRTLIQAIPDDASSEEVWEAFRTGRHSRLPIYRGTVDHIVGILLLKDLIQKNPGEAVDLHHLAKTPIFVPESKSTVELLRELQRVRSQLALVVDEFGSVSGLVTVEDLLEEVVGEIGEEHEALSEIQTISPDEFLVSGQVHIEDLEEFLGLSWSRSGFDTVAGLIMARLGHVPKPGERLEVEGATFTVLQMEGPRVLQVRVRKI
ncbi:MAG: CBS/transporter domain protein [Holophagaceae bacterium]|nr:CBS/transporter domain protein [Holophagaceae bacterium]